MLPDAPAATVAETMAMTEHSRPLVKVEGNPTPAALVMFALQQGTNVEQLEKLMGLQERWEANEARKAYVAAMSKFKAAMPRIFKDRKVDYSPKGGGRVKYAFAQLSTLVRETAPLLGEFGLSVAWETQQNDKGMIVVTCSCTHEKGHRESVTLNVPHDTSGSKNAIQAVGSAVTYAQRYTYMSILGIAAEDMDDADAPGAPGWARSGQQSQAPEGKADGENAQPRGSQQGQSRPQKVIATFKKHGLNQADLELFAGNFEHRLPPQEWTEDTYQAFTDAKDKIAVAPADKRGEVIRDVFQLEPGATG